MKRMKASKGIACLLTVVLLLGMVTTFSVGAAETTTSAPTPAPTPVPTAAPTPKPVGSVFPITEDSYIRGQNSADLNFGIPGHPTANDLEDELYVKAKSLEKEPDQRNVKKAYLKVNFTGYSENSTPSSILHLYVSRYDANVEIPVTVVGLTDDSWKEGEITWNNAPNNQPTLGPDEVVIGVIPVKGVGWYQLDVTDFINSQMSDKIATFKMVDLTDKDKNAMFASKDATGALAECKPFITIVDPNPTPAPTGSVFPITEDSYVRGQNSADLNFGIPGHPTEADLEDELYVKAKSLEKEPDQRNVKKAYLKVDFKGFTGNSVSSSVLHLYVSRYDAKGVEIPVTVVGLTDDSWKESEITWNNAPNNQPTLGPDEVVIGVIPVKGVGWYQLDVTEFIKSQMSDKVATFKLVDLTDKDKNAMFASKDATGALAAVGCKPFITIVAGDAAPAPANELVFPVTEDTYVRAQVYQDQNFGVPDHPTAGETESEFYVKSKSLQKEPDQRNVKKAYLKIDFRSFSGKSVSSAKLHLYVSRYVTTLEIPVTALGLTDDSWKESEITWNNAPNNDVTIGPDEMVLGTFVVNGVGWYELDITDFINSQMTDKVATIKMVDLADTDQNAIFASKDATDADYGAFKPYMTLVEGPAPSPIPKALPTVKPAATPTPKPTAAPTVKPTAAPTPQPTAAPTTAPTAAPAKNPDTGDGDFSLLFGVIGLLTLSITGIFYMRKRSA